MVSLAEFIKYSEILFQLCGFRTFSDNQGPVLYWGFQKQQKTCKLLAYKMIFFFFVRTDSDSVCLICLVLFGLSLVDNQAGQKKVVTRVTNQPITTRQDNFFMTLITSSFPSCSLYVCVSVYRVFSHLESELCFPLGPFPCSENSSPSSLFLQTPLLLLFLPKPVSCKSQTKTWPSLFCCTWAGFQLAVFVRPGSGM